MTYNISYKNIIKVFIALLAILYISTMSRPVSMPYINSIQLVDSVHETYYPIEALKSK